MSKNTMKDTVNRMLDNYRDFELPMFVNGKLQVRITSLGNEIVFEPMTSGDMALDRINEIKDAINSTHSDRRLADVIATKTFATAIDGGYASTLLGKKAQLGTCAMLKAATTSQQENSTFGFLTEPTKPGQIIEKLNIPTIQYKSVSKNGILVPVITENGMVASANKNGIFVDYKRISPEDFELFCIDLELTSQIKGFPDDQVSLFIRDLKNYSNPIEARLANNDFVATDTFAHMMYKASDIYGLDQKLKPARVPTQITEYKFTAGTFNMGMGMDGNLHISNPNGLHPEITREQK